jgi:RimJ/RimL family protein N-acetyltransferase
VNGRLAAWCIVACGTRDRWPLTETNSELELQSGDAVFTAGFVAPEFRRRRLFQAMYGAAADLAAVKGARQLWSWCEVWNEPSRRAMLAVGFQYLGSRSRRTILGIRGKLRVESVEGTART